MEKIHVKIIFTENKVCNLAKWQKLQSKLYVIVQVPFNLIALASEQTCIRLHPNTNAEQLHASDLKSSGIKTWHIKQGEIRMWELL